MIYVIAFLVAIFTGFFSVSIGGGGLLLVPILILMGLSPQEAIATSTFGYISISIMGLHSFNKAKKLDKKLAVTTALYVTAGAVVGAFFLPIVDPKILVILIGVCAILLTIVSLAFPDLGLKTKKRGRLMNRIGDVLLFGTGFYKSLSSAGASSIASYILIFFHGQSYLYSSGTRKLAFLLSNILPSVIFAVQGFMVWPMAFVLFFGQMLGSHFGAEYAIKKGEKWMKYGFSAVVLVSAVKMLLG